MFCILYIHPLLYVSLSSVFQILSRNIMNEKYKCCSVETHNYKNLQSHRQTNSYCSLHVWIGYQRIINLAALKAYVETQDGIFELHNLLLNQKLPLSNMWLFMCHLLFTNAIACYENTSNDSYDIFVTVISQTKINQNSLLNFYSVNYLLLK